MRTEATPTSNAEMIMDPVSAKRKDDSARLPACAQIVPKNHQKYRTISKDIEVYRYLRPPKNARYAAYIHFYLYFSFFRRFLHTVEVTDFRIYNAT